MINRNNLSAKFALKDLNMKVVIDEDDLGLFMHLGIETGNLTQNQVDTILIPSHAPENYMCDGEITSKQAKQRWMKQLVQSGLPIDVVGKAIKLVD